MRRVEIQGTAIDVDEDRTAALYEERHDWCQCDGCTNARMMRRRATPAQQAEILLSFGLDPNDPFFSAYSSHGPKESAKHARRNSCWFAYGRVVGADASPQQRFDRYNWMWIESRRDVVDRVVSGFRWAPPDEPDLIYVIASNTLPWLYDEVCNFRSEFVVAKCPFCGSNWRETGYLRKRSMIPTWMNLPQLDQALRDSKHRVYVEFCSTCGSMEHRIVEDKKPFRTRNNAYRDWQRAGRGIYSYSYPRHLFYPEAGSDEAMTVELPPEDPVS